MCRCIDVQFVLGLCLERLGTSNGAHRRCRRGALCDQQVNALDSVCFARSSYANAWCNAVTRIAFSRPRGGMCRPICDLAFAYTRSFWHGLDRWKAGCFDFEECLLSVYCQVNIVTLQIVESWTIISDDPVFVTVVRQAVVRQSAARPPQSLSWKLGLGFLAQDTSKLQVVVGPDIPPWCRTCSEYGGHSEDFFAPNVSLVDPSSVLLAPDRWATLALDRAAPADGSHPEWLGHWPTPGAQPGLRVAIDPHLPCRIQTTSSSVSWWSRPVQERRMRPRQWAISAVR